MDIKNKVAIVTGASKGIGLATAKLFSQKGAKLVLVSRSEDRLENIARDLPDAIAVPADMTKLPAITRMIDRAAENFGGIDILVNNAGQGYDATVEDIKADPFHYIFDLNVLGPVIAMQQAIPFMRKRCGGAIVNVSSGLALMYLPGMGAYASLKRALAHISLTAREELKDYHISVSVVYPYITLTDFEKNTIKTASVAEDAEEGGPYKPDSAEFVAGKILEAVEGGDPEIFAHDWMNRRNM